MNNYEWIHDEERLIELSTVIERCLSNGEYPIALAWVQEYNEIIDRFYRGRVDQLNGNREVEMRK